MQLDGLFQYAKGRVGSNIRFFSWTKLKGIVSESSAAMRRRCLRSGIFGKRC